MTDEYNTPRTQAQWSKFASRVYDEQVPSWREFTEFMTDFACQLERELTLITQERDALRLDLQELWKTARDTLNEALKIGETNMNAMKTVSKNSPLNIAWEKYKATDDFVNSRKWALLDEHVDGALWAAFMEGFNAASPPAPAKDGMSESCPVCGGNDKDVPCAYPSEEKLGCFRDSRLNLINERERNLIAAGWNYLNDHSPANGRKLEEALAAYEGKEEA